MTSFDPTRDVFHTRFMGHQMLQYWADLLLIQDIIEEQGIKGIVEIGTASGGLSLFLGLQALQHGIGFLTIDINPCQEMRASPLGQLVEPHTVYLQEDCFYSQKLRTWISQDCFHPLLFLCDGGSGNKPREFKFFGPQLRPDDIIAAHDFNFEFLPADIVDAHQLFSFESYFPTRWDSSYWYWAKIT